MSTFNLKVWPVAIPAAAALSLFGVVGTSTVASAEGPGPGSFAADTDERPAPETVPYFGAHLKITRDGVYVRYVVPDGPADVAGIQAEDKIVSVNGVAFEHRGAIREAMDGVVPGDVIAVVYERGGVETSVRVEVGSQADRPGPEERPWFGAFPAGPDGDPETGLTIGYVSAGSPADEAGVKTGDVLLSVNGIEITDPREGLASLRTLSPGDTLVLEVERDGSVLTIAVVLGAQADNTNREADIEARAELREDRREHRQEWRDGRQDRREDRREHRGEHGPGGPAADDDAVVDNTAAVGA